MTKTNNKANSTITGTYSYFVTGHDWGAGVGKAVLKLERPIDSIKASDITVIETRQATDWNDASFPVVVRKFPRKVLDIHLCDSSGNMVDGCSNHVAVDLEVSPKEGSPLLFSMETQKNTWSNPYFLEFFLEPAASVKSSGERITSLEIAVQATGFTTSADMFNASSFQTESGKEYEYVIYEPETRSDSMVVWLHGMGEGCTIGSDVFIPLLSNKAAALAGPDFQSAVNNALILVPQCPTMWMDDGSGLYTKDGKSVYTSSLKELIDHCKNKYGAKKVVLTGCSNGGYMVLEMMKTYPGHYKAGVAICAALKNTWMTNDDIARLKDQPLYFIYSNDDPIVDPLLNEAPIIQRLKKAGATSLAVATTDSVFDTSGRYRDHNGGPHKYNGHWSWIHFDNNEATDDLTGEDSWSWIARQLSNQ